MLLTPAICNAAPVTPLLLVKLLSSISFPSYVKYTAPSVLALLLSKLELEILVKTKL